MLEADRLLIATSAAMDDHFAGLHDRMANLDPASRSLNRRDLNALTRSMARGAPSLEQFGDVLTDFFRLTPTDMEAVCTQLRAHNLEQLSSLLPPKTVGAIQALEPRIADGLARLNAEALRKHGCALPLAILRGFKPDEDAIIPRAVAFKAYGIADDPKDLGCPQETYNRYLGPVGWKWVKMHLSVHYNKRWRKQDPSCNWNMIFPEKLEGWFTYDPYIFAMVALNGWGLKLAANTNCYFIKSWTMIPYGIHPVLVQFKLFGRKP